MTTDERLFQLREEFEKHKFDQDEKLLKLIEAQQVNTKAISELTVSVSTLVDDTSAIVQLHKDFQGAARVGVGVQSFMLWTLKWGAIGTGVYASITWLVEHFGKAS